MALLIGSINGIQNPAFLPDARSSPTLDSGASSTCSPS
jgi:hypothetical protein